MQIGMVMRASRTRRRARGRCRMAAKAPSSLVQERVVAWVIIPTRAVIRARLSMGIPDCGVTKLLRSWGTNRTESVRDSAEHFSGNFEQIGRNAGQAVDGLQL